MQVHYHPNAALALEIAAYGSLPLALVAGVAGMPWLAVGYFAASFACLVASEYASVR